MLSVFSEDGHVLNVGMDSLSNDLSQLKSQVLARAANGQYQYVQLYDQLGLPVIGPTVQPYLLSYAIVASSEANSSHAQPIKITIRKTDKTGNILFKHPSTTVAQLKQEIQKITGVESGSQELIHRGTPIGQSTGTIGSLNFVQSSILHLIDLSQRLEDKYSHFSIFVQMGTARQFTVSGTTTAGELKTSVGQAFEIPRESLLMTYCGRILDKDDVSLYDEHIVPGAYVNVIQEKKPVGTINTTGGVKLESSSIIRPPAKENTTLTPALSFSITTKQPEIRRIQGRNVFGDTQVNGAK